MASKTDYAIKIAKIFIEHLRQNNIKVDKAYLYGSYVNGNPREESDIDIVVVSSQFKRSRFDESVRLARLRRSIDLRISPLAYHPKNFIKDNIIPYEAMTNGIRIA